MQTDNLKLRFVPYVGLEGVLFGDKRAVVHQKLGKQFRSFVKGGEQQESDQYCEYNLVVYYDNSYCVDFFELYGENVVLYEEMNLCDPDYKKTMKEIKKLGHNFKKTDVGYQCDDLGFSLYIPCDDLEGVSLFKKHYYDD